MQKHELRSALVTFLVATLWLLTPAYGGASAGPASVQGGAAFFFQNIGQYPPDVLYYADGPLGRWWVLRDGLVLQVMSPNSFRSDCDGMPDLLRGAMSPKGGQSQASSFAVSNIFIRFPGGSLTSIRPERPCETRIHLFRGKEASRWITNIPTWDRVRFRDIYAGVDLVLEDSGSGLAPWRFERTCRTSFVPHDSPRIDSNLRVLHVKGGWRIPLNTGEVFLPTPQVSSPAVGSSHRETGTEPAITSEDPQELLWGTFIHGSNSDGASSVELDSSGNIVVSGYAISPDLPVPLGYDATQNGDWDIYVAKLSPEGNELLWGTYIGGSARDLCSALQIIPTGEILVTGNTKSPDCPTPHGLDTTYNGGLWDIYGAKLSPDGNALLWGTYLGGSGTDFGKAMALGEDGDLTICGHTDSEDMATPGAYDATHDGEDLNFYVARLSGDGQTLRWGTYLGGSATGSCNALALDPLGNVVLGGHTYCTDMPIPGGYDPIHHGWSDMYIAKLSSHGSSLLWGTYVGGSGYDQCNTLRLDGGERIVIGGSTTSKDIPVPLGFDPTYNGGSGTDDMYLAMLSPSGESLLWGTYLGGTGGDSCFDLALDADGDIVFVGSAGIGMPTAHGFDTTFNGVSDIYVGRLSSAGNALAWGTYVGGARDEGCGSVRVNAGGQIVLAGSTASSDIPVPTGFDADFQGCTGCHAYYLASLTNPAAGECTVTCHATVPPSGRAGEPVAFRAESAASYCPGSLTFTWDFGDGEFSNDQAPHHTYTTQGLYTWTLTVLAQGASCTHGGTVLIAMANIEEHTVLLPGEVPLILVHVPAGEFQMGSPVTERGRDGDEVLHTVRISHDFYLGKYEVTQGQWESLMGSNPASDYGVGPNYPVYNVSWNDIADLAATGSFLARLDEHLIATGQPGAGKFRLPTEAEWEYACRAEMQTRFYFGDALSCEDWCTACELPDQYMWWCGNDHEQAEPVGSKGSNAFGLHDMHGNLWEWCQDWYGAYPAGEQTDPGGPESGSWRVLRGGDNGSALMYCRSALRNASGPDTSFYSGFRLAADDFGGINCILSCEATISSASGTAPLAVAFAATATATSCTGDPTFAWTFGDGASSMEQNPSHTFSVQGSYSWTLTVSVEGKVCTQTGTVVVIAPCILACEASAQPSGGKAPLTVAFTSIATPSNCIGEPVFTWTFEDGSTSTVQDPIHTYTSAGMFTWTFMASVQDTFCTHTGTVTVEPSLPGDCDNDDTVSIGEVQKASTCFWEP